MLLVNPPVSVNSEVFRMYYGQDATKQVGFDLSNISPASKVTLSIRDSNGKVVVGEYSPEYRAFLLKE